MKVRPQFYSTTILLLVSAPQFLSAMAMPDQPTASGAKSNTAPEQKGLPYPAIQQADNLEIVHDADGSLVSVLTKMNYVTPATTVAHIHRDISGSDSGFRDVAWEPTSLQVHNARPLDKKLHENGFELVNKAIPKPVDFLNTEQVINDYYPHCEALLKEVLGDKVAIVKAFDHNIRLSSGSVGAKLKGGGEARAQVPLGIVHGDYTKDSGPQRLDDLSNPPKANDVLKRKLGETPLLNADQVQGALGGKRRFALINVWRSIDTENPVQELPLACVDSSTASDKDLRVLQIHYPDRIGENYFIAPNANHQWCYFPHMTHSEAMLIKQWDSYGAFALGKESGGPSTFAIHSAFFDPNSDETSAPRRSIEVRCAVMWEED